MNSKPLIIAASDNSLIHNKWINQYIDILPYDSEISDIVYNIDTVFMITSEEDFKIVKHWVPRGNRFIMDGIWETQCPDLQIKNSISITDIDKFFWFNEKHHCEYNPKLFLNPGPKKFFMPMYTKKPHRDALFDSIDKTNTIHSYVDRGIVLEENGPKFDRYYEPQWYEQTQYSIVSETYVHRPFVTEKTYKPIMYGHPFMIYSGQYHLKLLQDWGFVTYDCLFDESYDDMPDAIDRLNMICKNANYIEYTNDVKERIKYNSNHFWNCDLPEQCMLEKVVTPILEFCK